MVYLPARIKKPGKQATRCCEQCGSELTRKAYEKPCDFKGRQFCGRTCANRFRAPYVSRSENLLQNSESADERGCWNWNGYLDPKGYGRTSDESGEVLAHRLSYMEFVGPITDGLHVLHKCDNPSCINPSHLELGTNVENHEQKMARGRQFHPIGERNPKAKLTARDVREIRASSLPTNALAERFGVTRTNISMILLGRTWKDI